MWYLVESGEEGVCELSGNSRYYWILVKNETSMKNMNNLFDNCYICMVSHTGTEVSHT